MLGIFKRKKILGEITPITNIFLNVIIGLVAISAVYPFLLVLMVSFTDEKSLAINGYKLFPEKFSLEAYRYLLTSTTQLVKSYGVTIFVTVVGTVITVVVTALYAYSLSRKEFKYRKFFNLFAFFTTLFSGGLVPFYIVTTKVLGLRDSVWALILPMILNFFYIIILRTFFQTAIPESLVEAARIDGASEFQIFFKIIMPLSLPGLATIGLFSALGFWNDWFNALLFIENENLIPLQQMLMKLQNNMEFLMKNATQSGIATQALSKLPQEGVRMAMVILATGPIILAYPFFQKYFVQGLTIGGVKE